MEVREIEVPLYHIQLEICLAESHEVRDGSRGGKVEVGVGVGR